MADHRISFDFNRIGQDIRELNKLEEELRIQVDTIRESSNCLREEKLVLPDLSPERWDRVLQQLSECTGKLDAIKRIYREYEERSQNIVDRLELPESGKEQQSAGEILSGGFLSGWNGSLLISPMQNRNIIMEDWLLEFLLRWAEENE